jgi:periplasmic protein CpxP/Spy
MENENQTTPSTPAAKEGARSGKWLRGIAIGATALAALGGIGLVAARSDDLGGRHQMMGQSGMGGHVQNASMRHGMKFGERRMERMLDEIDATPEQAEKLKTIFASVREDMRPMFEDMQDTREDIADLLAAPTVDRAAAEKLRAERVAAIDETSRKLTAAILDAAEVLTPEQRKQLVEHFEERDGPGRW